MKTRKKNKKLLGLSIICFSIFGLSILLMLLTSINTITSIIGIFFHLCGMYFVSKSGYAQKQQTRSPKFMDPYSYDLTDPAFRSRYFHHRNKIF